MFLGKKLEMISKNYVGFAFIFYIRYLHYIQIPSRCRKLKMKKTSFIRTLSIITEIKIIFCVTFL